MEQRKNSGIVFSLTGGVLISIIIFFLGSICAAAAFWLFMVLSGGPMGDSAFSLMLLASPTCGGILGVISLIAAPILLYKYGPPREITTPSMKIAAVMGVIAFVVFVFIGAVGTHIYNLVHLPNYALPGALETDVLAGILCALPLGVIVAITAFLVTSMRRSRRS